MPCCPFDAAERAASRCLFVFSLYRLHTRTDRNNHDSRLCAILAARCELCSPSSTNTESYGLMPSGVWRTWTPFCRLLRCRRRQDSRGRSSTREPRRHHSSASRMRDTLVSRKLIRVASISRTTLHSATHRLESRVMHLLRPTCSCSPDRTWAGSLPFFGRHVSSRFWHR